MKNCMMEILKWCRVPLLLALIFGAVSVRAEMRVWEDRSGTQVKAEFIRQILGAVLLRRPDGSVYTIPWENLSAEDAEYVRSVVPPELELRVLKKERAKERNEKFVQGGDVINVITTEVTIRKKSREPYNGKLKVEVYLVGQEIATDDYRLCGKGTAPVAFTDENEGVYTFSTSADIRSYEEYNGLETRGAEYTGYLVVVVDGRGEKLATKSSVSWLTDEKVDKLRRLYVGAFFDKECRKRSVPRPRYYDARFDF